MKKNSKTIIPKFSSWLLKKMSLYNQNHSILWDFEETFNRKAETEGILKAKLWYWKNLLKSLPEYLKLLIFWRFVMFKNYLKIAARNLLRQKGYSFINIFGLAIAIVCCILIMFYVNFVGCDFFHYLFYLFIYYLFIIYYLLLLLFIIIYYLLFIN